MKIAVGTTSNQKIGYLEEVLKEIELDFSILSFEVSSQISEQPLSNKETKKGSINRAKNTLAKSTDCDFAIGIEVGYHPNKKGNYKMFCWATIIDPKGKQISAKSHQILLPKFYQQLLKENKYLSDYVDQYLQESPNPPYKYIATLFKNRKAFVQTAIEAVVVNYLIKK